MKQWAFYLVVLLQVLFLVLMSVSFYAMDSLGQTIRLKTAPVDPRDPFYGDYVTLSYEVEQIPGKKWVGNENIQRGERVYLLLESNDQGIYQLVEASNQSFEESDGQVILSGKYQWHDGTIHRVEIGLDRYYIEENTGEKFERNSQDWVVEVVIAPWGQRKITSLE